MNKRQRKKALKKRKEAINKIMLDKIDLDILLRDKIEEALLKALEAGYTLPRRFGFPPRRFGLIPGDNPTAVLSYSPITGEFDVVERLKRT